MPFHVIFRANSVSFLFRLQAPHFAGTFLFQVPRGLPRFFRGVKLQRGHHLIPGFRSRTSPLLQGSETGLCETDTLSAPLADFPASSGE